MLNLYLAPRSGKAPMPADDAIDDVLAFLADQRLIGNPLGADAFAPGVAVAALFHGDADELLLPAELTFESLSVHRSNRARFLPVEVPADEFEAAVCTLCDEPVDTDALLDALEVLVYRPVERFDYLCPSCRTALTLWQIDFGQPTAVARFWIKIEGAAFGRLTAAVVEQIARRLGHPLVIVPEVPEDDIDDWVPARRMRRGRGRGRGR